MAVFSEFNNMLPSLTELALAVSSCWVKLIASYFVHIMYNNGIMYSVRFKKKFSYYFVVKQQAAQATAFLTSR